ncbi:hypothetical protein GCM10010503_37990 [Streptomyces lucensis JCM 4490]|uniref:Uncharacterized protein n=1 Tax=Streptomyces lucensis JCM 4490 TaxID=1306176 RepID=A0A918MSV3_9ACTN|nr:hypothetical protein GCM10010503_37990 [Streptomyces lucensis JCM 4490]
MTDRGGTVSGMVVWWSAKSAEGPAQQFLVHAGTAGAGHARHRKARHDNSPVMLPRLVLPPEELLPELPSAPSQDTGHGAALPPACGLPELGHLLVPSAGGIRHFDHLTLPDPEQGVAAQLGQVLAEPDSCVPPMPQWIATDMSTALYGGAS